MPFFGEKVLCFRIFISVWGLSRTHLYEKIHPSLENIPVFSGKDRIEYIETRPSF